MKSKYYLLLILNACMFMNSGAQESSEVPSVSSGEVVRLENFSSKYVVPRNVDIWLPEGYSENDEYAVIYMHDGQNLFDPSKTWLKKEWKVDEVVGELIKDKKITKCIVVGIWNSESGRTAEYFPQKPYYSLSQTYRDSLIEEVKRNKQTALFSTAITSDNYLRFIVEELKPYIDKNYSTMLDPQSTVVAGSSFGGLISIYAICEYPDVFGAAMCMSTHWVGAFTDKNNPIPGVITEYLAENLPDPATHKIYFDYGTETLDAMYEPFQLAVDAEMQKRGYTNRNWRTMKFEGHDHSEDSWSKRLHIPMTFLLGVD